MPLLATRKPGRGPGEAGAFYRSDESAGPDAGRQETPGQGPFKAVCGTQGGSVLTACHDWALRDSKLSPEQKVHRDQAMQTLMQVIHG